VKKLCHLKLKARLEYRRHIQSYWEIQVYWSCWCSSIC